MGTPRRADTRNGAQKEAQVPASHLHGSTGDSGGDARVALPNLQVAMSVSPAALATGSALATALQQWRVSDEVLGVLLRGGIHAMEVLARAPMVGPLAEVAPRVLQGIAEVRRRHCELRWPALSWGVAVDTHGRRTHTPRGWQACDAPLPLPWLVGVVTPHELCKPVTRSCKPRVPPTRAM